MEKGIDSYIVNEEMEEMQEVNEMNEMEEMQEVVEVKEEKEVQEVSEMQDVEEVKEKEVEEIQEQEVEEVQELKEIQEVDEMQGLREMQDVEEMQEQEVEEVKDSQDIEDIKGKLLSEEDEKFREYPTEQLDLIAFIKKHMSLPETDVRSYSPLTLAFIGDVVYDLVIRTVVVEQGNAPVNKLHKKVSNLVKAPTQMKILHKIEPILTEDEFGIYKRGRNAKSFTSAKNASMTEYRSATGFEALIGYLYLDNQFARIIQLIQFGLK